MTDVYIALQKRTTSMISFDAEARYKLLTAMYPAIVQRVLELKIT